MNKPMEPGAEVDSRRFSRWVSQFSAYRSSVTIGLIELWLKQFSEKDRDVAARVLDAVLFISHRHIHTQYREMLEGLAGWNHIKSKRHGRWYFVPFSGSVGESGDSMVHALRMATSMTNRKYNELFIHRSELVAMQPGRNDTVVLVDDFSGTGKQACDSWRDFFAELLTGGPRVFLILIAATTDALSRITSETGMEPVCATTLQPRDNFFNGDCKHFTNSEKTAVLGYCALADPNKPKGFGDSGLLLVFAHRCPNNSVPILHAVNSKWQGLFPRHDA